MIEGTGPTGFVSNYWMVIQRAGISVDGNKYWRRITYDLDKLRPLLYGSATQPEMFDMMAAMGADPAAYNMYFNIYSGSDAGIENVNIPFAIKLTYVVELLDPVSVSSS